MKCEHIIILIVLHTISIETRTSWVYSLKSTKDAGTNNAPEKRLSAINVSSSDVEIFVKVLNLLRHQLEYEVEQQNRENGFKRTVKKCTDLERDNENEIGIILPIPDPLEDLTLLSLLYDDTANWSKCTRSCKSQRVRKCRARGLCSLDYMIEEAFCYFPKSKCARKVKKLVENLNKSGQKSIDEENRRREEPKQDEEYQPEYDYDNSSHRTEESEHNQKEHIQSNDEEIYKNKHNEEYEYNHEENYHHNNNRYDYDHGNRYVGDDEDYPANRDQNYNYHGQDMDHDYHPNYFWDNDDYSYGDPNISYDCPGCEDAALINAATDEHNENGSYDDNGRNLKDEDDGKCGNTLASVPKRSFRIIGGHRAVKGAWPWQVAIVDKFGVNFCAGTIIAARWVLTAAHCAKSGIRVRIAEHDVSRYDGEVEFKIRKSFPHPQFDIETYDRDIALLKLPRSVLKTKKYSVKKACLPQQSSKLPRKKSCVVLGWGLERESHIYGSDILMYAKVPIVSDRKCYDAYADSHMTKNMFCAGFLRGGPDACSGDSGGPLLCQDDDKRWVIQGVVSFGEGCGERGKFGVYTKVKNFLSWINKTINEN